jgi:hypothetical protein
MKKIEYQTRRVRCCFNRVIELNQKMLILKRLFLIHHLKGLIFDCLSFTEVLITSYRVVLFVKI